MESLSTRRIALVTAIGVAALGVAGTPAEAAPPAAPEALSYQGLLLDALGDPRTGNVDLTLRIFDAASGGTLVYVQSFTAVPLADGVFTVELGPTGAASDGAAVPLTTDLGDVFTADLGAGPDRFLEVTVGAEGPLGRTQILSAPFALRAGTAESAASADDAASVGGVAASFVSQLFAYGNSDGGGPANGDPEEGLGDTDGDGIANFVDPDNDDDGILDIAEGPGSSINLVTPTVTGAIPASGRSGVLQTVTVTGTNFESGISASFGGVATPPPTNVTSTSFDVEVGVQPREVVDIVVTRLNGEQGTEPDGFEFGPFADHDVNLATSSGAGYAAHLDVTGTQRVVVSGTDEYEVDTDGDAQTDVTVPFASVGAIAVAFDPSGTLVGLRCRATGGGDCDVEVSRDSDADDDLADETGTVLQTLSSTDTLQAPTLAFGPLGEVAASYRVFTAGFGGGAVVAHDRDANGDFLGTNESAVLFFTAGPKNLGEVDVDGAGRVALATHKANGSELHFYWDRSGDGDWDDAPGGNAEQVLILDEVSPVSCVGAAFAPDGDPVVLYAHGSHGTVFVRDLNQDGDFADAGEQQTLAGGAGPCDVEAGPADPVALAYADGGDLVLRIDRNDDGDFDDADETVVLAADFPQPDALSVSHGATGRPFVATFDDTGATGDNGEILTDWTTP